MRVSFNRFARKKDWYFFEIITYSTKKEEQECDVLKKSVAKKTAAGAKGKLLKSTVAASLVFGSIAGLPLGGAGLQTLLATKTAQASVDVPDDYPSLPPETDEWLDRLTGVYAALTADEKEIIQEFRQALLDLPLVAWDEDLEEYVAIPEDEALVDDLVGFLNQSKEDPYLIDSIETLSFAQHFAYMLVSDSETLSRHLNSFRNDTYVRAFADKLLHGTGVTLDGDNQIQFADLAAFAEASETALLDQITVAEALIYIQTYKSGTNINALKASMKAELAAAIREVLADQSLKVSQALAHYAPSDERKTELTNALADAYMNLSDRLDPHFTAQITMMKGLIRSHSSLTTTVGTTELTPELIVLGTAIPNSLINWTASDSLITFANGKFTLSRSAPSNTDITSTVYARDSIYDELLFSGSITLRRTASRNNGSPTTPTTPPTPPVTTPTVPEITANDNGEVDPAQLTESFQQSDKVTVKVTGDTATLPASALKDAPEGATVAVENSTGSYSLPVDALDYEALAEELGAGDESLEVEIKIAKVQDEDAEAVEEAAEANGGEVLAAVEFSVEAKAGNQTVEITDFGSTYVERTINVDADSSATGVLYDPATGEFSFIPAKFADGIATLKSTTNSIYAVLGLESDFADVDGHWSESHVESMANKLIVEGYEDGTFGPDVQITRAEFATLIVRALGLSSKTAAAADFSDVASTDWFANAVALAVDAGIVNGYEDGTFQPNKVITREELAAMVVRASAFAGTELSVAANEASSILAGLKDADTIVWADAEIAAAVDAGIIEGYEDGTFGAGKTATRAEASTMIRRFLANAGFIDN